MKTRKFRITVFLATVTALNFFLRAGSSVGQVPTLPNDVWIAVRTDGKPGTGTVIDPYDGSTQPKFDGIFNGYYAANATHITFHLGPGTFQTDPITRIWYPLQGWMLDGEGMYATTIQSVSSTSYHGYTVLSSPYNVFTNEVTLRNLTLDCNWAGLANVAPDGVTVRALFDGVTVNGSPTVTSVSGAFSSADIGRRMSGNGIPLDTFIGVVNSPTSIGLSSSATSNVPRNATASASGVTIFITENTINGVVRTFTTSSSVNASATIPSTNGNFTVLDVGRRITGAGVPPNSWIGAVIDSSNIVISSSAVMNVPVNATIASGTTLTISEKNVVCAAASLSGNNNTYDHVRAIGAFGTGANGRECFILHFGATYNSAPQDSANNTMSYCLVENCYGNYANPFALGGNEGAPSPSYPGVLNFLYNNRVEYCCAIGRRGPIGYSIPGSATPFTSGGVNLAGVKNCRIHGNYFQDCTTIAYQDTGTFDGVEVSDNTLVRGQTGVNFVVDRDGFSGFTVSGAGYLAINGYYYITGQGFNGKPYYNLTGHAYSTSNYAVVWNGAKWIIADSTGTTQYESSSNVNYPWQATGWTATQGATPVPSVIENRIITRGVSITGNRIGIERKTIGGANYAIIIRDDCGPFIDKNFITYDLAGPGNDVFWPFQVQGTSGTITNNVIDLPPGAIAAGVYDLIGDSGVTNGTPDSRYYLTNNRTTNGDPVSGLTDTYGPSEGYATGDVWIAIRTDGQPGTGTQTDPYDGSTETKFDTLMGSIAPYTRIHLGAGTFRTAATHSWAVKPGWVVEGTGIDSTTVQVAGPLNGISTISCFSSPNTSSTSNVILRKFTIDCNWPELASSANLPVQVASSVGAIYIYGSNNLIEDIKSINTYGSLAYLNESFAIGLASPLGTSTATGNIIRFCHAQSPMGNYSAPFALHGCTNSSVYGNLAMGVPFDITASNPPTGFSAGGVDAADLTNCEIYNNTFIECMGAFYASSGSFNGVKVFNDNVVDGWLCVAFTSILAKQSIQISGNSLLLQNRLGTIIGTDAPTIVPVPTFMAGASYGIVLAGGPTDGITIFSNNLAFGGGYVGGFAGGVSQSWGIAGVSVVNAVIGNNTVESANNVVLGTATYFNNRRPDGSPAPGL